MLGGGGWFSELKARESGEGVKKNRLEVCEEKAGSNWRVEQRGGKGWLRGKRGSRGGGGKGCGGGMVGKQVGKMDRPGNEWAGYRPQLWIGQSSHLTQPTKRKLWTT